jgi:CubicO group peptidase (beta-lactamase class C family)
MAAKFLISLFLVCLLGTSCSSDKKQKSIQSTQELQQQLEAALKEMNVPGVSVALVNKNGTEWVAGVGKADVATGRAATADTLFRIGSISKAFASLATLKLVQEGKLSLEDPVRKLAPEVWFENRWEESDPVRVVNLLEHTTGWDDVSLREYAKNDPNISLLDAFNVDHHSRISRWPPSTRMAYCNSGPPVAAFIVEKLTGKKFADYVAENFFKPIGMKTATYSQPAAESTTTLYHADGKTPHPYWNFLYPSSGMINASAKDMASYIRFYLNRGKANDTQILPATAIERMESPTSTWAAKEGLKAGYGLGNYWTVYEGFVYHGHNGGVDGGLSDMGYIPDLGVGYFYSINSGNAEAFLKIGKIIRAHLTQSLKKPSLPKGAPLPKDAAKYAGWYEPDSPRVQMFYFLERLFGMAYLHFENDKLLTTSFHEYKGTFLPVKNSQFRYVPKDEAPHPVATAELLKPPAKGTFIQLGLGMTTIKQIPTWLAITQIATTAFVILSIVSILIYAPFWIFGGLKQERRRPKERAMRLLPLLAALSLLSMAATFGLSMELVTPRMGNLTGWSLSLFIASILFALFSLASVVALWRAPKENVRLTVRLYSTLVTIALLITTAYFAYWGIIGLRTWA